MWEAFALLLGLRAIEAGAGGRKAHVVPEPEFVPFNLPSRSGQARGRAAGGTRHAEAPVTGLQRRRRTLEELGVPGPLAAEIEASLKAMGMVEGDRIRGFTFRTPDGAEYRLRAARPAASRGEEEAA